jgi:hypothetical protein
MESSEITLPQPDSHYYSLNQFNEAAASMQFALRKLKRKRYGRQFWLASQEVSSNMLRSPGKYSRTPT